MNRVFKMSRTFMEVHDELYEILKEVNEASIPPGPLLTMWKEYLGADKIFRKDGKFYFVKMIEEAVIISEEITKS